MSRPRASSIRTLENFLAILSQRPIRSCRLNSIHTPSASSDHPLNHESNVFWVLPELAGEEETDSILSDERDRIRCEREFGVSRQIRDTKVVPLSIPSCFWHLSREELLPMARSISTFAGESLVAGDKGNTVDEVMARTLQLMADDKLHDTSSTSKTAANVPPIHHDPSQIEAEQTGVMDVGVEQTELVDTEMVGGAGGKEDEAITSIASVGAESHERKDDERVVNDSGGGGLVGVDADTGDNVEEGSAVGDKTGGSGSVSGDVKSTWVVVGRGRAEAVYPKSPVTGTVMENNGNWGGNGDGDSSMLESPGVARDAASPKYREVSEHRHLRVNDGDVSGNDLQLDTLDGFDFNPGDLTTDMGNSFPDYADEVDEPSHTSSVNQDQQRPLPSTSIPRDTPAAIIPTELRPLPSAPSDTHSSTSDVISHTDRNRCIRCRTRNNPVCPQPAPIPGKKAAACLTCKKSKVSCSLATQLARAGSQDIVHANSPDLAMDDRAEGSGGIRSASRVPAEGGSRLGSTSRTPIDATEQEEWKDDSRLDTYTYDGAIAALKRALYRSEEQDKGSAKTKRIEALLDKAVLMRKLNKFI